MTNRIPESQAGCWLDGHFGWQNHYRVVDRAQEWGYVIDADDQKLVDVYRLNGDVDKVIAMLLEEKLGSPGPRGGEVSHSVAALQAEAEALIEDAATAMLDQGGLVDKATDYLNSLAPEGMIFDWDMGELSLLCLCQIEGTDENMAVLKSSRDNCDRCAKRWG